MSLFWVYFSAFAAPPPLITPKPCFLQSHIDASDSGIVLFISVTGICLCLSFICLTCVLFTDPVLTNVGTHKQNQTCMQ